MTPAARDGELPVDRDRGLRLLPQMVRIRRFEERCVELYSATKIRGFLHLCIGEEAVAVGFSLRGGGLIAPAIHDADQLSLDELMAALRDLVARARSGRLRSSEMSDPTITVTNLGDQGADEVHGVIYPPQVALVGFGRIAERPWAEAGMVGVRPTVGATVAADHRASDGLVGARSWPPSTACYRPGGAMTPDEILAPRGSGEARALLARLLRGIAPEIDLDEIDPADPLPEAAELDSMDFLNLVNALYDETGIEVPERDYPLIATIDGFVAYVTAASPREARGVS